MTKKLQKRDASGNLIFSIDCEKRRGTYFVTEESSQYKFCEKITIVGFDKLPRGFYTRKGFGLSGVGNYLFQPISDKYARKVSLKLVAEGSNSITVRPRSIALTLVHSDLLDLNDAVKLVKRQKNQQIAAEVARFLGSAFPDQFPKPKRASGRYVGGSLAKLVAQKGIYQGLTLDDRRRLESFIPQYLSSIEGTLRAKKKLKVVFDSISAGRKVYLSKVLAEFKSKLALANHSEAAWQSFLSSHILLLRSSYAQALEKKNVSLEGKFPDFMLVDPYGYVDVYEIKTPATVLLRYDNSRDNYYWSTDLAKAISQAENYLFQIERHSDDLATDLRKAKKLDITIVRPRGYIIAGVRRQLASSKMRDDFRILNESMKNLDVLFYDDLLANLESFLEKVA